MVQIDPLNAFQRGRVFQKNFEMLSIAWLRSSEACDDETMLYVMHLHRMRAKGDCT